MGREPEGEQGGDTKRGRDRMLVENLGVCLNDGHFVYWCHHWAGEILDVWVSGCRGSIDDAVQPESISRESTLI